MYRIVRERLRGTRLWGAWREGNIVLSFCSFLQGPTMQWRDELAEVAPFSYRKCPWRAVTTSVAMSGYFRPFSGSSFCCPGFRNCIWRHEIMKKGYCFWSELSFENIETESTDGISPGVGDRRRRLGSLLLDWFKALFGCGLLNTG